MSGQADLFSIGNPVGVPEPRISKEGPTAKRAHPGTAAPRKTMSKGAALVLRVHEAAERIGLSVSTLNKMRCDGRGPPFIKLTGKTIGYMTEDLDAWVAERRAMSE
jgi:predicted DNA-binding transcriptional regulator AlpA